MAVTRPFSVTVNFNGTVATFSSTLTGDAEPNINGDVAGSTTNKEFDANWLYAGLQGWLILADGVVTIKTNSTSVPDNTWTTVANTPIFWVTGMGTVNPIGANITKFYITNGTGTSINVKLFSVSDQSP